MAFVKGEVMGFRRVQYTSSRDNQPRSGYEIHVHALQDNVQGVACLNFYCSDNSLMGYLPKVGDDIVFHWDPRNRRAELVPSGV